MKTPFARSCSSQLIRSGAASAGALAFLMLGTGCASLPPQPATRASSTALADTGGTTLGRSIASHLDAETKQSVFYPLSVGAEAFVARLGLCRAAERSLDVQYYMIHNDATGSALFREMLHAANRGVRVRLLIDDIHTEKEDALLAALDAHEHIEVRIFNPFVNRSSRMWNFVTDYRRVNRRMHNKSITADNQATIVGGRNVGDEYFAAGSDVDFSDLDVLAGGPVVPEVSAEFDRYWNSAVVWPVGALVPPPDAAAIKTQYDLLEQAVAVESQTEYAKALPALELVRALREQRLEVFKGTASVIADPPEKVTQPIDESAHAILKLSEIMEKAQKEIFLISPYFVPGGKGTDWLVAQAKRGVKVRILTNSFLATDVGAVHSGYMPYRDNLLRAGIEIYELKRSVESPEAQAEKRKAAKDKAEGEGSVGSSHASLHAKTYMVDGKTIFVGSLNLDPRSARINTEMGIVLESEPLANRFRDRFDPQILDYAYRVELTPDGRITWTTREGGKEVVYDKEPGMSGFKRFGMFIARVLPMEEQL